MVDGEARIVAEPPLIVPIDDLAQGSERDEMFDGLHELLRSYRATLEYDRRVLLEEFRLTDFARKVVGVGSVGTRAWIALMLGRDGQDPLFLQMKEAEASVLEEFVAPSEFENHGERVVTGQRLMQATSDIFLGWLHVESGIDGQERDFYGRQLKDWKGSAEIEQMVPKGMAAYGRLCGWTLARAHARSGDRIAIAAYLGKGPSFDRAIVEFSHAYAEQNERDYKALADGGQVRPHHRRDRPLTPAQAPDKSSRLAVAYSLSVIAPRSRRATSRSSSAALEGAPAPVAGAVAVRMWLILSPIMWAYSPKAARIETGSASGNSSAIWLRSTWAPTKARIVNSSISSRLRVAGIGPQMKTRASSAVVIQ